MRHIVSALVAMVVGLSPALAHHSWAGFEITPTTFEGRIERVRIENPHTLIEVRGANDQHYVVVWSAINGLVRRGYTLDGPGSLRELLKVGDTLVVTGRFKREEKLIEVLPQQIEHRTHGTILAPVSP